MSRRLPRSFLSRMAPCPYPPVDLQLRAMATTSKAVSTSTGAFNTGLAATASGESVGNATCDPRPLLAWGYRSRYCWRAIRITSEREVCVLATYCSRRASKLSGRRTCLALECTPGAVRDGRPRRIRARA